MDCPVGLLQFFSLFLVLPLVIFILPESTVCGWFCSCNVREINLKSASKAMYSLECQENFEIEQSMTSIICKFTWVRILNCGWHS